MIAKILRSIRLLPVLTAALLIGCRSSGNEPVEHFRIEISGMAVNPIDVSWTVHDQSGTVEGLALQHPGTSPFVIRKTVLEGEYGPVEVEIGDSGSTGNRLLGSGNYISSPGTTEKLITLDFDTQNPLGSGNYIFDAGDYLRDASTRNFSISREPTGNRLVYIYDTENRFSSAPPSQPCWIYATNRSSITVTFLRDGVILHSMTGNTATEAVDMAYGSSAW